MSGSWSFEIRMPFCKDRAASFAIDGSAPQTDISTSLERNPDIIPELRPPPPTGAMIASIYGTESANSVPSEAFPEITYSLSYALHT